MVESPVAGHLFLEPDGEEAPVVECCDLVLERELLEPGAAGLDLLVGAVQSQRVLVDLDRLLLDGAEHPGERVHQRLDFLLALVGRRPRVGGRHHALAEGRGFGWRGGRRLRGAAG